MQVIDDHCRTRDAIPIAGISFTMRDSGFGERGAIMVNTQFRQHASVMDTIEPSAERASDEAAVRALYQRVLEGWNRGSGEAFAAAFAAEGQQVAFDGTRYRNREEIATAHQALFDKWMKGTKLVGDVTDVQFFGKDTAVAHAAGSTIMKGKSAPSPNRNSVQTLVAVRQGSEWRIVAFDNIRARSFTQGFRAVLYWMLSDGLASLLRLNR
jgi:uncharacterized protein (TIGR02246 family)